MSEFEKNIEISLDKNEARIAALTGVERKLESIYGKYDRDEVGNEKYKTNSWDYEINGAAAELAFGKYRGCYWGAGVNTFKKADLGKTLQVRHTDRDNGRLIVRPGDNRSHKFILVVGKIPRFRIVGWMLGKDAMVDRYIDNPNRGKQCWMVPQSELIGFKIKIAEGIRKAIERL